MAKTKPCRGCGHSKTQHTRQNDGSVTRCKYRYAARDGRNLHVGVDTDSEGFWKRDKDGRSPRHFQCFCPRWLPEEIWEPDPDNPEERIFAGYEDDLDRNGNVY